MNSISLGNIAVEGEIWKRAAANLERLEQREYDPANLFQPLGYSWPGDTEGRTILAWVLLAQSTQRNARFLEEVIELLPGRLNEQGFMGRILSVGELDEQQLSGNSWLLRGLCEYYEWTKDASVYRIIKDIVDHLLLPTAGYYTKYPVKAEERIKLGEAIGELTGEKIGNWYISSDIGCAFIMLDGAAHAYELVPSPHLKALLDEMIERFISIDFVVVSMQTHATLSALRGMMRYYSVVKKSELLKEIERIYQLYRSTAMTDNYENHNWFGRPEWTETCAVVDSYILAVQLWQHTNKANYLEDAYHILINGMGYGQRPNGGFGCNVCVGGDNHALHPHPELFEAYWCCSMRGGEGLARAIQYTFFQSEDTIWSLFHHKATATFQWGEEALEVSQQTAFPILGETKLTVTKSSIRKQKTISLYIPEWVDPSTIRFIVNGQERAMSIVKGFVSYSSLFQADDEIVLYFSIGLRRSSEMKGNARLFTYRHGSLLLGVDSEQDSLAINSYAEARSLGEGSYHLELEGITLSPVNQLFFKTTAEATKDKKVVIFSSTKSDGDFPV